MLLFSPLNWIPKSLISYRRSVSVPRRCQDLTPITKSQNLVWLWHGFLFCFKYMLDVFIPSALDGKWLNLQQHLTAYVTSTSSDDIRWYGKALKEAWQQGRKARPHVSCWQQEEDQQGRASLKVTKHGPEGRHHRENDQYTLWGTGWMCSTWH